MGSIGGHATCAVGDGARVLIGCRDGVARVWTPGRGAEPLGRLKHPQAVSGIARAGEHVVTASLARSVRVSSVEDGRRLAVVDALRSMPWCLACSPDDARVAVGVGHAIQIRELPSLRLVDTWKVHRAVVSALRWTRRGLWSGAENGTAVRHAEDGRAELVLGGRGWVQDIASAPALTCVARAIEHR